MPDHHKNKQTEGSNLQSINQQQEARASQQQGNKKKNNTGIPDRLKAAVEHFSGFSLDEVRVHYNSEKPAAVGALAFAEGLNIYVAPGEEKHLAHELWHIVQQMKGDVKETTKVNGMGVNDNNGLEQEAEVMGNKTLQTTPNSDNNQELVNQPLTSGIVQRYVEEKIGGSNYRVAEDLSVAVRVGYPNHLLYAKAGKADAANTKLAAVKSGIELEEQKKTLEVNSGGKKETLTQVLPKNTQNKTEGDNMDLWADCGKSAGVVVGGTNRKAEYRNPDTTKIEKTKNTSPAAMKAEIMLKLYNDWLNEPESVVSTAQKKEIVAVLATTDAYDKQGTNYIKEAIKHKSTDKKKYDEYVKKYRAVKKLYAEAAMKYYNSLPEDNRNDIDAYLQINKSADPEVGQGYTMSSGGDKYPGTSTWNFHWGGVVMKSDDNKDNITLENYATGVPTEQNKKWDFAMYGTKKEGQTFHEQHHDTKQHGKTPTTLVIEND